MADNENHESAETVSTPEEQQSEAANQANEEVPPTSEETPNEEESNPDPAENGQSEIKGDFKPDDESEAKTEKPLEEGSLINATEDNDSKMFVGGLSWDTETFGLRDYFSKFGEVKDCTIKKDGKTERSRGFGFVLFADPSSVQKVMETPTHYLDGRKIDPKRAQAQRKDGKVFVGGISPDTDNDKIKEYFSKFGEIEVLERPKDKTTGKLRGFCFITFKKDGILKLCCADKHPELDGVKIEVKEAQNQEKNSKFPGRGGMGRGGGWGGPSSFPSGGYYAPPYMGYGGGAFDPYYQNSYSGYYGGGAYGGGGKTAKPQVASARHRGGGWGDTRSGHTSWHGHRGNFHGAYQGYHDY